MAGWTREGTCLKHPNYRGLKPDTGRIEESGQQWELQSYLSNPKRDPDGPRGSMRTGRIQNWWKRDIPEQTFPREALPGTWETTQQVSKQVNNTLPGEEYDERQGMSTESPGRFSPLQLLSPLHSPGPHAQQTSPGPSLQLFLRISLTWIGVY